MIKLLQAGAGLVLVFGLAERLRPGGVGGAGGWAGGDGGLAVAAGRGARSLLASAGVGYASLTLFELFPRRRRPRARPPAPSPSSPPRSTPWSAGWGTPPSSPGRAAGPSSPAGRAAHGRLSPSLSVLLLVWGVAGVLAFVVPALTSLALVLSLVALLWLGAVLLGARG